MIDYLKLLIKNINTSKKAWFPYPFDMDEIRKTLHLKDNEYKIINYNSSMPIYLHQFTTIGIIEEDYKKYLSLPKYIIYILPYILSNINKIIYKLSALTYTDILNISNMILCGTIVIAVLSIILFKLLH